MSCLTILNFGVKRSELRFTFIYTSQYGQTLSSYSIGYLQMIYFVPNK